MKLSVVIPTHNRKSVLLKTLDAFENQSLDKKHFEIVVVGDDCSDGTSQAVVDYAGKTKLNIIYSDNPASGVSAARNYGIKKAKGDIVLLLNDDTMPVNSDFLERHISSVSNDAACLGRIDWHPELDITEVMNFLSPNGPVFNFGDIRDVNNCGWRFFYTSNVSLLRSWFDKELFDEDNPFGNEDIELGYRLSKRGLRIRYNSECRVFHYHRYESFDIYLESRKKRKPSYDWLIKKHPELRRPLYMRLAYPVANFFFRACYKFTGLKYFRDLWWRCAIRCSLEE